MAATGTATATATATKTAKVTAGGDNRPDRHLPQSYRPPASTTLVIERPRTVLQLHQTCELLERYPNPLRMSQRGEGVR